jgi:hypothetical protein
MRSCIPCPQWRVVNLLQERGVGGDLVRDANWFASADEFHKRPFYLGLTVPDLRLDLEIALIGASARLSAPTGFFRTG